MSLAYASAATFCAPSLRTVLYCSQRQRLPRTLGQPRARIGGASPRLHTASTHLAPAQKSCGAAASQRRATMILLRLIDGLAKGEYGASSVKDARQLARVAAVMKEALFLVMTLNVPAYDRGYVLSDEAALIRRKVTEWLVPVSTLTYEDREQNIIVQVEMRVSLLQGCRNLLEAALSCARMDQEIDENIERLRAESERASARVERERVLLEEERAEYARNEAERRIWDKRHREYMESGDDYGERERVFRKRALEGDADAAAYLAEREEYLWERSGLSRDAYRKRRRILDRDDWEPIFFE